MAQVRDDLPRLWHASLRGVELTAVIGIPTSALLATRAPEVIDISLARPRTAVITPFAIRSIAI